MAKATSPAVEPATGAGRRRDTLSRDLAAAISRARALCEAARALQRGHPLLRALSLRGGSDQLDPALSEPRLGRCGICGMAIRGGESLLYRESVTIHLDCAFTPPPPGGLDGARRRGLETAMPPARMSEPGIGSFRCSACGSSWQSHALDGQCPGCIVAKNGDLVETTDRCCVACTSPRIERIGLPHWVDGGPTRALHRCRECAAIFVLLRSRST